MGFSTSMEGPDPRLDPDSRRISDAGEAKTSADMAHMKDTTQSSSINGQREVDQCSSSDGVGKTIAVVDTNDMAEASDNNNVDMFPASDSVAVFVATDNAKMSMETVGEDFHAVGGNQALLTTDDNKQDSSTAAIGNQDSLTPTPSNQEQVAVSNSNHDASAPINSNQDSSAPVGNDEATTTDSQDTLAATNTDKDSSVVFINDNQSFTVASTSDNQSPITTSPIQTTATITTQNVAKENENNDQMEGGETAENHSMNEGWMWGNVEDWETDEVRNHNYLGKEEEEEEERLRLREEERCRIIEEEKVLWLKEVEDKEAYVRTMNPQYHSLDLCSTSPIQESHLRRALTHLARRWPWWRLRLRRRGASQTPWLCTEPLQPLHTQIAESDECKWSTMEEIQTQHKFLWGGPLCTATLLGNSHTPDTDPASLGTAAAVDTPPVIDGTVDTILVTASTNDATLTTSSNSADATLTTSSNSADATLTTSSNSADATLTTSSNSADTTLTSGDTVAPSSCITPVNMYTYQLLLGVPKPFAEESSIVKICDTLVQLLDDVMAERITTDDVQRVPECASETESQKTEYDPHLEVMASLQCVCGTIGNNADIFSGNNNGEVNEDDENSFTERTIEQLTSQNFINKCKAKRISYLSAFVTCVSAAAANLILEAGAGPECGSIDVDHRVFVHYNWPEPRYEWHDNFGDNDNNGSGVPPERPAINIKVKPEEWNTNFWRTAKSVYMQQWEINKGHRSNTLKIPLNLDVEDGEEEEQLPCRFPNVDLSISNIRQEDSGLFNRRGEHLMASGLNTLSPLHHFLFTHHINLQVHEESSSLRFYINQTTLFLSSAIGRRFADEIESVVRKSLKYR
nr:uncharacterized protein LOC123766856 [Procambarus clarkii]